MKEDQTVIESNARKSRETEWILRLFAVLLACMATAFVIHAIGQVVLIVNMCL